MAKLKVSDPKVVVQRVRFDLKGAWVETKYSDGRISLDPIDSEEAAALEAKLRGF